MAIESYEYLPVPQQVTPTSGSFDLAPGKLVLANDPSLTSAGRRWQQAMQTRLGYAWELSASPAVPEGLVGLSLSLEAGLAPQPQGYLLRVTPQGIQIAGHDPAGVFYGVCTLIQHVELTLLAGANVLPGVIIQDWPDFAARGVMLDISRDKVYRMDALYDLVERLAGWKINQLQLYTEHTFAYHNHPQVWAKASPMTGDEILALDAFCQARHIELVPNQNSFGHMQRWLIHPRYKPLAEAPRGYDYPWGGHSRQPFSLCPLDPGSLELIRSLYDELLPHFSSCQLNVGCDETWDLGQGRSREACQQRGTGEVYLDFLKQIHQAVGERGRVMQFWGDIILQHPVLIPQLPGDAIALEWGYEADHPFDEHGAQFAAAGLQFYVCPGTSAWNSIAGRTDNALENLRSAAENGLKHGAIGYLNTDWGDNGHFQPLPVSYLGFAAGAAYSWAYQANQVLDLPAALDHFAFQDRGGVLGKLAFDLGNVYQLPGLTLHNNSVLFSALIQPLKLIREYNPAAISLEKLQETQQEIDRILESLEESEISRPDADWLKREFQLAGRMLKHGAQRIAFAMGSDQEGPQQLADDLRQIITEHRRVWRLRCRTGGLNDSAARLKHALRDYR